MQDVQKQNFSCDTTLTLPTLHLQRHLFLSLWFLMELYAIFNLLDSGIQGFFFQIFILTWSRLCHNLCVLSPVSCSQFALLTSRKVTVVHPGRSHLWPRAPGANDDITRSVCRQNCSLPANPMLWEKKSCDSQHNVPSLIC